MNPLAILMAIEQAAAVAKSAKNLISGLTGHALNLPAEAVPGGGMVLITADMVREAVARGEASVDALGATADGILERLRAEGKIT